MSTNAATPAASPELENRTHATCNTCGELKPTSEFYSSLARSFYFCRSCCAAAAKLRRQVQPEYRLLSRARACERRQGTPLQGLGVETVRKLLADLAEPGFVEADQIRLVRRCPDLPLAEDNAELVIVHPPQWRTAAEAGSARRRARKQGGAQA